MTERLIQLLQKQKAYYEAIWDITQEESERLNRGSSTINLLKKKRILVACIEEIDLAIFPLREQYQNDSPEVPPLVEELNKLLQKTLQLDQQNQQLLKQQLSLLKAKMASAHAVS
jgi:hypothetical protein